MMTHFIVVTSHEVSTYNVLFQNHNTTTTLKEPMTPSGGTQEMESIFKVS